LYEILEQSNSRDKVKRMMVARDWGGEKLSREFNVV
jgi:hypothetical protein